MANYFEKRASEYLRDETGFLSVVTTEPLHTFIEKPNQEGRLFDRLCLIVGTPGSGKTTIATLLQYKTIQTLINSPSLSGFSALINALKSCGFINDLNIEILGCRIPIESEYRDLWELPYSQEIRIGLLKSFLQARSMLLWLRSISEYDEPFSVTMQFREGTDVAEDSLGGSDIDGILKRASEIERLIYEIGAALVPPSENQLNKKVTAPYHPFDVIEYFILNKGNSVLKVKPLVMLDDVHTLHPEQLSFLMEWLAKREMKIGRWMFMRFDAQTEYSVLLEESKIKKSREITFIPLQSGNDRSRSRNDFRIMAKNMANKYLQQMSIFVRQGQIDFSNLLNTKIKPIPSSKLEAFKNKVNNFATKNNIPKEVQKKFQDDIEDYFSNAGGIDKSEDLKVAILNIMLNRYLKRTRQTSFFDDNEHLQNPLDKKPIKVNSGLVDGAKIFLLHEYNRPYFYGINAVCDASSENAEQFLQLASKLVRASESRMIRSKTAVLTPSYQHELLVEQSKIMVKEWAFPKHNEVRKLCEHIASECIEKSLEPNASLGGGANSFGILQKEFEKIPKEHPELAKILKYGMAYNAISIKHNYSVKHKIWTLVELSGHVLVSYGLTLARGGILERTVDDLLNALRE